MFSSPGGIMENIIDVMNGPNIDSVLQRAINALRANGVRIAAAAKIYDSEESLIGRILLEHATDKPEALQTLAAFNIRVR
jgi:hypothetical protein